MSAAPVQVEATGETVGEARWAALHELERLYPALDRSTVEFVVVSEGQRGLLGVGYEPARVVASLREVPEGDAAAAMTRRAELEGHDESEQAGLVRRLLHEGLSGLQMDDAELDVHEADGQITATVHGDELGLLIGKHGQTIDAVQYLANAMLFRHSGRGTEAVVDAQGYRKRRERTLAEVAARAVAEARATAGPVSLEPMSSAERKVVHTKVQEFPGMATSSEGTEPNRYVVVRPALDE